MKILQWMQKRLNGNIGKKKPSSISATHCMIHEPCKQEFSDWPQGLLAIGTFGTKNLKEEDSDNTKTIAGDDSPSFQDRVQQFTINLQNELNIYFRALEESNDRAAEQEEDNYPNDDLINKKLSSEQHSSLEEHDEGKEKEKENDTLSSDGSNMNRVNFYHPSSSVMFIRGKDRCLDHNSKSGGGGGVGKKSLSFLLKKMFVCGSGFEPIPPLLKDPSLSTESRMEKILREILHKKIYPSKGSSSTMVIKKYLETRPMPQSHDDGDDVDEDDEFTTDAGDGCKWVKSDAEYIVLEI